MPSPPYASLRVSLDGGAVTTGGITATLGQSCQLSADPAGVSGSSVRRFEIYGHPSTLATPSGWTLDVDNTTLYYVGATPPAFLLTPWGKYMFRLILNNGISTTASIPSSQLIDESTAISVLSPSGLVDVGTAETDQFSDSGWVAPIQANLRTIETALGTTSTAKALGAAKAASTANVASLSGAITLDGVSLATGDVAFLKNQTSAAQNGPWVVNSAGAWTRTTDFNTSVKVVSGQTIVVTQGTTQSGTQWALTTAGPFTLGTTALNWQQISGAGGTATAIAPVRAVATSNLTLSGTQTVDGVALNVNDRIAVIGQTLAANNGIYVVASGSWSRSADYSTGTQMSATVGQTFLITEGTLGANRLCVLTTTGTITIGVTDLIFKITIKAPVPADALKFIRLNSAGSDYEPVDINSVVTGGAKARAVLLTSITHSGVPAPYDGVTLAAGDIVLDASTTGATRGLWVLDASTWIRPSTIVQTPGLIVAVTEGAYGAGTQWQLNAAVPFTLDTTSQSWSRVDGGAQTRKLTTTTKTGTTMFSYPLPWGQRSTVELTFTVENTSAPVVTTTIKYILVATVGSTGTVTLNYIRLAAGSFVLGGPTFTTGTGTIVVTWNSAFTSSTNVAADVFLTQAA